MEEFTLKETLKKEMTYEMQRMQEYESEFYTCISLANTSRDLKSNILDDYEDFLKNSLYFKESSSFGTLIVKYHDYEYLAKLNMFFEFLESPYFKENQY